MLQDAFILSIKNLKHRGFRSWLTLLGIFVGVTAVVALISLGSGLKLAVASQFGISSTEVISIQAGGLSFGAPPGTGVVTPLTSKELEAIRKIDSIKLAIGRNINSGKLEYNDKIVFGVAASIPDGKYRDFVYEQLDVEPIKGRFLKDSDHGKVMLGYNFYIDKVGLNEEIVPGKKVLINDKSFEVIGIVGKKGSFILDNAVYMQEDEQDSLFNNGDTLDIIAAQVKNKDLMDKAKEDIEKVLRKVRDVKVGEEDFKVSTPQASMSSVNDILGGVTAFIAIIASISIFIGAIGIVNTMTTSVLERRKDIGIMKSIGARNKDIFMQFFIESSMLGLIGGVIGSIMGTIIGVVGTIGINNFIGAELVPVIDYGLIALTLLGSFLIGGLAGIVPAMNAARQNPVEALSI